MDNICSTGITFLMFSYIFFWIHNLYYASDTLYILYYTDKYYMHIFCIIYLYYLFCLWSQWMVHNFRSLLVYSFCILVLQQQQLFYFPSQLYAVVMKALPFSILVLNLNFYLRYILIVYRHLYETSFFALHLSCW